MFGPIAFLTGLLMVGGAVFSAASERSAYETPKTYTGGHPDFWNLNSNTTQRIRNSVYGNPMPVWVYGRTIMSVSKEPDKKWLLPIGGFDVERIEKEIGFDETAKLLQNWLILELGYSTTIDEEKMKKYCWSGDYMSPYLPAALEVRKKYPTEDTSKIRVEYQNKSKELEDQTYVAEFYEDCKQDGYDRYIQSLNYRCVAEKVVPLIESLGVVKKIQDDTILGVGHRQSINKIHTGGRDFIELASSDVDLRYFAIGLESCYSDQVDYVDMLKAFYPQHQWQKYVVREDKARETLEGNKYLEMCDKHKSMALEFANKYVIEDYGLNGLDVCQITKAASCGPQYSPMRREFEDVPRRTEDFDFGAINNENYIFFTGGLFFSNKSFYYPEPKYDSGQKFIFYYSKIKELNQMFEQNQKEFIHEFQTNDQFAVDFMTCMIAEDRTIRARDIMRLEDDVDSPDDLVVYDYQLAPELYEEEYEQYKKEYAAYEKRIERIKFEKNLFETALQKVDEFIPSKESIEKKKTKIKEPQLRLRDSSEFQN